MSENLFVYGTLHPDHAPDEIAHVVKQFKTLGSGTIRARFHRFRDFPAIKIDPHGDRIDGEVFRIPGPKALKELDDYEEYYPAALQKSLFHRKQVKVRLKNGSEVDCWVYEYNQKLPPIDHVSKAKSRSSLKKTGS